VHALVAGSLFSRFPALKHGLHMTDGRLGLALLVASCVTFAGTRVAPVVVEQWGSKPAVRVGSLLLCAALLGPALAPTYAAFVALLATLVFLGGFLDVAFNAQGIVVERGYGRPIMSGLHGAWSIGLLVGSGTGAGAAALGLSPTVHFSIVAAAVGAASVPLLRPLLPREAEPAHDPELPRRPPLFSGVVLGLGAIGFAAFVAEGAGYDWSAVYLHDVLRAGGGVAASAVTVLAAAMAAARLVADRLTMRLGPVRIVRAGSFVAAAGFALALIVNRTAAALAGFALLGAGVGAVVPTVFSAAGNTGVGSTSAVLGRVVSMSYVGSIAGPAMIGFAADAVGLRAALGIPAALALAIAGGAGVTKRAAGGLEMVDLQPRELP
jgi:predicted MFS family arabinose efflux permease